MIHLEGSIIAIVGLDKVGLPQNRGEELEEISSKNLVEFCCIRE